MPDDAQEVGQPVTRGLSLDTIGTWLTTIVAVLGPIYGLG